MSQPSLLPANGVLTRLDTTSIDVSCCKLSTEFFDQNANLKSYAETAKACAHKQEFRDLLNQLGSYKKQKVWSQEFSCIVTPSGTGKSQLAGTAARINDWNVVYYYTGTTDSDGQEFYKPHIALRNTLMTALRDFKNILAERSAYRYGSDDCYSTFSIRAHTEPHAIFQLLFKCFFGEDSTSKTHEELKKRVQEEDKQLLVFLDGMPSSKSSKEDFELAMLLRNLVRATGVGPILLSTHTENLPFRIDGVKTKPSSSRISDERWCRVFCDLPKYQPPDERNNALTENPWLCETERPMVAAALVQEITEKHNISTIVDEVKQNLHKRTEQAWWKDPALQLRQLVCRMEENPKVDEVVDYHGGHICLREDPMEVYRDEPEHYVRYMPVKFVHPEKEPILFLATTSWKMDQLDQFADPEKEPLLFLAQRCWKMRLLDQVLPKRPKEEKPNNKRMRLYTKENTCQQLEALAVATITLASLQSDDGIFQPVGLSTFLASAFCFVSLHPLCKESMMATACQVQTLLEATCFSTMDIPTCPSAGACFTRATWRPENRLDASKCGSITQGKEEESGWDIVVSSTSAACLHVECKNGLDAPAFKLVVGNMLRSGCKVSLLFIPAGDGVFSKGSDAYGAMAQEDLGLDINQMCILVLQDGSDPRWLSVSKESNEGKSVVLEPQSSTEYLMVVVSVGVNKRDDLVDQINMFL